MSKRFIICIDVESDDLCDAYKQLDRIMHQEVKACEVSWESTEDVYNNDGELEDPKEIEAARTKAFNEIRTDICYDFPTSTNDYGNTCLECDTLINYGPRSNHDPECRYFREA